VLVKPDGEILKERAAALARPVAAPPRDTIELVTFQLTKETYGIESRCVVEVFPLTGLARLPGAKPPLFGVTAWRGEILSVLDIRPVLGVAANALNDLTRVIVLGDLRSAFGILADAVGEVISVPTAEIREPAPGVAAARQYVRGVTSQALLVLATEELFTLHA
jgi:purine-binding chemotaxis protein CheW